MYHTDPSELYVDDASMKKETSSQRRRYNLSSSTFGICNKHKNTVTESVQASKYLGLAINLIRTTLSITVGKTI